MREFIVAEIATNWPKAWPVPTNELLAGKFEEVIEHNLAKGYRLHSFQVHRLMVRPEEMNETLIAVFEKVPG